MDAPALCATHRAITATGTCPRCGDFLCGACLIPGSDVCQRCRQQTRKPVPRERVPVWGSVLALFIGGIAAQVAGALPILVGLGLTYTPGADVGALGASLTRNFAVLGPSIALTGLTMAGIAAIVPMISKVPLKKALGLRGAPWPAFLVAPVGILALGPTSDALRRLAQEYAPWATFGALEGLDEVARSAPLWAVLPAMALVPGVCEELLFRGMFQRSMKPGVLAVIASGVLFAVYHMDPHHVVAVLPLGLYLAWLGYRTDSVLVPITSHVVNNAMAVLGSTILADSLGPDEPLEWWWVPTGWAVAAVCVAVVWWSTRRREPA